MQWILGRYRYRYWVFPKPRFGRWLARVLGLAAILFFLVACGDQPPTEPASLTPTASGEAGARILTRSQALRDASPRSRPAQPCFADR